MKRVVVHIDRLVLHAVDHADRGAVVAAIEQELTQRLGAKGMAERLVGLDHRERLSVARVRIGAGSKPAVLGAAVAGRVADALVPTRSAS